MKIDDEKVEPVTDLRLSLDYCSRYDQRRSNDDPSASAGANAGSSVRMAFVSANPLTELVWSPHTGLSLKCAECSFTERKPSLLWGVGTSTVHESLPETNIAALRCSIVSEELNSTSPKETVNAKIGTSRENNPEKFSILSTSFMAAPKSSKEERAGNGDSSDDMMDKKPPIEASMINKSIEREEGESGEGWGDNNQKYSETCKAGENSLPDSSGQVGGNSINSHIGKLFNEDPSSERTEVDPNNNPVLGLAIVPASEAQPLNEHEGSHIPVSSQGKGKSKQRTGSDTSTLPHLDKLESTAENDLQMCNKERAFDVAVNVVASESDPAGKTNSMVEREINLRKKAVAAMHSPGTSRIHKHHCKGKGKALSDGDLSGRLSKEDDDSSESVESCNSAGLISSGKRRWSFEQQLIVGSKRAKQIENMPGSSSLVKHDSSFMHWISNMMKGLTKSNQDEEDLLALALSNPNQSHKESRDHSLSMDRKKQPLSSRNMGFKSIFQSIYCPNKTAHEARTSLCSNLLGETPMEIDPTGKRENSVELQALKENLCKFESGNAEGPSTLPQISFGNFAVSLENRLSGPAENKNSSMLEEDRTKETVKSSNSSQIMLKTNPENNFPSAEEKMTNDVSFKGGSLGSLWIARFSTRPSVSLLKQESPDLHRDQVTIEVKKSSSREFPSVADNEPKNCGVSTDASTCFRQIENSHDKNLIHNMHRILPSERVKSSEAMASIFARRLDALKNIIPSHLIDGTSRADTTCFFCGIKGHHLQNCSDITEAELEDLLKNLKSYDNAAVSPRLCIRCFQLNHWAAACPNASSNLQKVAGASLPESNHRDRFNCSIKFKEVSNGHNMISNLDKYSNLSHEGKHSNENQKKSSGDDVRLQTTDVPKGIFTAVKMLRLCRADILKWMNSEISLSHLDGFFLRLRLGKWEEGLGGTGYYVACISGMQREERSLKNAKSPISVSIGGIKCLVESQYISNHDFLEDELMIWWCTTSRGGGKIPSEEDLKRKAEEKKKLGF